MMKRLVNWLIKKSGVVGPRENVEIEIADAVTGRIIERRVLKNKVVDSGLNLVRDLLANSNFAPSHIAVGDDNADPSATQTALVSEVFRDVITRRISSDKQIKFQLFIAAADANGYTLREAGIFNAALNGDMLSRVLIEPEREKTAAITVTVSWTIEIREG